MSDCQDCASNLVVDAEEVKVGCQETVGDVTSVFNKGLVSSSDAPVILVRII